MGRPRDVAELVRQGKTPAEIATKLRISVDSVKGYLHRAVGEGLLRRSDIYFSVPREHRVSDQTLANWYTDTQHALDSPVSDARIAVLVSALTVICSERYKIAQGK